MSLLSPWIEKQPWERGLPLGTFVVTVTGSFLLAFFGIHFVERDWPQSDERHTCSSAPACVGASGWELEHPGLGPSVRV